MSEGPSCEDLIGEPDMLTASQVEGMRRLMPPANGALPFSIGSTTWPGTSKLIEECGEVLQVLGKLIGTGGASAHWDGSDLEQRLTEELGDLSAALHFFVTTNGLDWSAINERKSAKWAKFYQWHEGRKDQS